MVEAGMILQAPPPPEGAEAAPEWFCVRSRPKQEHIAAGHLRTLEGVEVFLPRIRFKRTTRRGPVWVTEALFPGYLFARFNWRHLFRAVHHAPSVSGLVHFGPHYPTVSVASLNELRAVFGQEAIHMIPSTPAPGDPVEVVGGPFSGLQAVVSQVMPGRERVRILLEFLGRQTVVEVAVDAICRQVEPRLGAISPAPPLPARSSPTSRRPRKA